MSKNGVAQCLTILQKYSDVNHPLSTEEIIDLFNKEYNQNVCRQTVSSYIKSLREMDIEIPTLKKKCYFDDRIFEDSQVELLCHSIMSCVSISQKYSEELIDKLKSMQSVYFADNYNLDFNIKNVDKRDNKELFFNIELISKAIDDNMTIKFKYHRYNSHKVLEEQNKEYHVVPLCTLAYQNRFYLIAQSANNSFEGIRHYRIDKIKTIVMGEENHLKKITVNPYKYSKHRLYMQSGDILEFELEVDKNPMFLDELIDVCGLDIKITDRGDYYLVRVLAPETSIIYFACQYIQYVKLVKPISTKNKIIEILNNKLLEYKKEIRNEQ